MTKFSAAKNTKENKKERRVRCNFCTSLDYRKNMIFAPDPYKSDILGDYTKVWEHPNCRKHSADEC
jgi:hypothetical protein